MGMKSVLRSLSVVVWNKSRESPIGSWCPPKRQRPESINRDWPAEIHSHEDGLQTEVTLGIKPLNPCGKSGPR